MTLNNLEQALIPILKSMGENTAKANGHYGLYQRSQSVPGFQEAERSWERAFIDFWHKREFKNLTSMKDSSKKVWEELYFSKLGANADLSLDDKKQVEKLKQNYGIEAFSKRLTLERRNIKRRSERFNTTYSMLTHWLHGFLWLMSDVWGSYYLSKSTRSNIEQETYTKCRQRLKLVGWNVANENPIIEGLNKKTGRFVFAKGWTNLASD